MPIFSSLVLNIICFVCYRLPFVQSHPFIYQIVVWFIMPPSTTLGKGIVTTSPLYIPRILFPLSQSTRMNEDGTILPHITHLTTFNSYQCRLVVGQGNVKEVKCWRCESSQHACHQQSTGMPKATNKHATLFGGLNVLVDKNGLPMFGNQTLEQNMHKNIQAFPITPLKM